MINNTSAKRYLDTDILSLKNPIKYILVPTLKVSIHKFSVTPTLSQQNSRIPYKRRNVSS